MTNSWNKVAGYIKGERDTILGYQIRYHIFCQDWRDIRVKTAIIYCKGTEILFSIYILSRYCNGVV